MQEKDPLLEEKLKTIINSVTTKTLGFSVAEVASDITTKLRQRPFNPFSIDVNTKYKLAKKQFKKAYIEKMLGLHNGNITEVSQTAGTDRRSIHRLIRQLHIPVQKIKTHLLKPYDLKKNVVSSAIEDALEKYKTVFHPRKMEALYKSVGEVSLDIAKELPETTMTLKDAEDEFEREYLKKALEENNKNITQTARQIGLRYETLIRKMKELSI